VQGANSKWKSEIALDKSQITDFPLLTVDRGTNPKTNVNRQLEIPQIKNHFDFSFYSGATLHHSGLILF
jgi:hypothetical protein